MMSLKTASPIKKATLPYFAIFARMRTDGTNDERALLEEVAKGNEKSFQRLFELFQPRLFRYVARFIKSEPMAEELVMDVFTKLWTGREMLTQVDNMDAFLFRIARNKSIDLLRSAARDPRFEELLWDKMQLKTADSPETMLIAKEFEEKLSAAIQLLSPQRKKVYELSRQQDKTHDQIAAELNISRATVNNHIVEARNFIRSYLVKNLDLAVFLFLWSRS